MEGDDFEGEGSMAELALLESPVIPLPSDRGVFIWDSHRSRCRGCRGSVIMIIMQVVIMIAVVVQMIVALGVVGWLLAHREAFIEAYQALMATVAQINLLLNSLQGDNSAIPSIVADIHSMLAQLQQINNALRRIG